MIKKQKEGVVKQKVEKFEFTLVGGPYTPPKWQLIGKIIEDVCGESTTRDKITIEYLGSVYRGGDWHCEVRITVEKNRSKLLVGHPIDGSVINDD